MYTTFHKKAEKEAVYRTISPGQGVKTDFKSNNIRLDGPSPYLAIVYSIFQDFLNVPYCWFVVLICLEYVQSSVSVSLRCCTLVPLILLLISSFCETLYHSFARFQHDKQKNSSEVQVLNDMTFTVKKITDIVVGDFVLVQNKEIIPADLVLLAVDSLESACFVDVSGIIGGQNLIKKVPVKETQSFISQDGYDAVNLFRHIEDVKVSQPNSSFMKFSGKIKMKGNPKAIKIGIDNLLLRESQMTGSSWAVGLVVYTGMETKFWINSKKEDIFKSSKMSKTINLTLSTFLSIYLILSFIFFGLSHLTGNQGRWDEVLVNFFLLFHKMVPVSYYLSFSISKVLQMLLINLRKSDIHIRNPRIFENLGRVEFVLSGKHGVLTEDSLKVQACQIKKKVYLEPSFNISNLESKVSLKPKSEGKDEDLEDETSHLESDFFHLGDLVEDLHFFTSNGGALTEESEASDKAEPDAWVFVLALVTCNYFHHDQKLYKFNHDEELLLELGERLGFKLVHRSINSAVIKSQENEFKFDILGTQGLYSEQKINKIVIKNRNSNESYLLVKGKFETIVDLLDNLEESLLLDDAFRNPVLQNLQKIIFGYKQLTEEETNEFKFDYKIAKLSPVNQEGRSASVFEKHEKNLRFLGIVGIENPVKPGTNSAITQLAAVGVKTWIVTGDSEESALLTGSSIGLYDSTTRIARFSHMFSSAEFLNLMKNVENREIFHLENKEIAFAMQPSGSLGRIRSDLNFIPRDSVSSSSPLVNQITFGLSKNKRMKNVGSGSSLIDSPGKIVNFDHLNFVISVDSVALGYVFSSVEIRAKFVELVCAARSVFFHSMLPDQKIKIVKLLKRNLEFDPIVLGIADGNTNTGMLGESDIGISAQGSGDDLVHTRDAQISSFKGLSTLIINYGHLGEVRNAKLLTLGIFKALTLLTVLLLYQFFSQFSAFNIIDYDLIVLFDLVVCFVPLLLVGTFYKDQTGELNDFQVYAEGFTSKNFSFKKILQVVFEGIFQGLVVFFSVVYGLGDVINSEGKTATSDLIGVLLFLLLSNSFLLKVFYENWRFLKLAFSIFVFIVLAEVLVVSLTLSNSVSQYSISHSEFYNQGRFWVIIVVTPMIHLIFIILSDLIFQMFFIQNVKSRLESYKKDIGKCFVDSNDWLLDEDTYDIQQMKLDVRFKSKFIERLYQLEILPPIKEMFRWFTGFALVISWMFFGLRAGINSGSLKIGKLTIIPGVILAVHSGLMFVKRLNWHYFITGTFISSAFFLSINTIDLSFPSSYHFFILGFIFCIAFNFRFIFSFLEACFSFIFFIICCFVERSYFYNDSFVQTSIVSTVNMMGFCLLILLISYQNNVSRRKEFIKLKQIKNESKTFKTIFSYLLPEFVRKRVKEGERYIAEDKGTVSVIFLDMCNFDDIVMIYSPQELTSFLDDIFGRIDKICESIGVTKIETVGKTYMACAGLKDSEKKLDPCLTSVPHARRAIELGLAVLREIKKLSLKDGSSLMFKIGINSGPVTAGVVGYHKPQFSLVGDTVNTASRMSSTLSEPNAIQITLSTFSMIGDTQGLSFEDDTVEVKGKGKMETKKVRMPKQDLQNFEVHATIPSFMLNSFANASGARGSSCKSETFNPLLTEQDNETPDTVRNNRGSKYVNSMITFDFKETTVELEFRLQIVEENFKVIFYGILVSEVIDALMVVLEVFYMCFDLKFSSKFKVAVFVCDLMMNSALILICKKYYKRLSFGYLATFVFCFDFVIFMIFSFLHDYPAAFFVDILCFRFILVNYCSGLFFSRLVPVNFLIFSFWMVLTYFQAGEAYLFTYIAFFVFIVLICKFLSESNLRKSSVLVENASKEKDKTEELLTNMLPHQALLELKQENFLTDRISYVTLMYADIVGFTAWSSTKEPKEVVGKLSQLFSTFDKLCLKHDVYKVHTIGDCYVVMGYKSDKNRNPAREALNVLCFAKSLVEVIEDCNTGEDYHLSMRVGIHTGEVIGGITGTNIVRYDIYGPDVLIANKMESNGQAGKVVVSESTMDIVLDYETDRFRFMYFKEIFVNVLNRVVKIFEVDDLKNRDLEEV